MLGWQAAIPMTAVAIICWLMMQFVFRDYSDRLATDDPAVWMWLGLLVFRAVWRQLDDLQLLSSSLPEFGRFGIGLAALLAMSWLVSMVPRLTVPPPSSAPVTHNPVTGDSISDNALTARPFISSPLTGDPAAVSEPTHTEKSREPLT